MATGSELQKMDEAAAELRRLMSPALDWAQEQEDSFFGAYVRTEAEDALLKNIRDTERTAQEWLTTWRSWAERGLNGSGGAYPVAFYLRVGDDLASAFATYSKLEAQAGAFVLGQTLKQSAVDFGSGLVRVGEASQNILNGLEDGAKAFSEPWPWYVKGLLGLASLGLLTLVTVKLVDKVPALPAPSPAGEGGAT